jgi:predicted metal-dependent phosphoesterase TrpH
MNVDLHCHSTASDGTLAPGVLANRAADRGVTHWALTDHDVLAGLEEAARAARSRGVVFVPGVEISVTWRGQTIHIVGLGVDPADVTLADGVKRTRGSRLGRAERMAERLTALGMPGALEGALALADHPDLVSRTHFARYLLAQGHARNMGEVFDRWLGDSKPAYVAQQWALLEEAVTWICGAGGVAVIAHPGRYRLSHGAMDDLIGAFRAAGGRGIEVVTGSHSADEYGVYGALARQYGLLASRGSDFHGPEESRIDLGALPPLPEGLEPVWSHLAGCH